MAMDFPSGPTVGQIVSLGGNQYIWDGTAWNIIPQQAPAALSDLPPANPAVGQFWWRSTNGQLYVYVNDGNSSQWVQAAGQGITPNTWELIRNINVAGVAQVDVTDLAAFNMLRLTATYTPVANSALAFRTSVNNGSSYDAGASDYASQFITGQNATTTGQISTTTQAPVTVTHDAGTVAIVSFTITGFNDPIRMQYIADSFGVQTSRIKAQTGGYRDSLTARNALRLFTASGGNMTLKGTLEGVRG